MIGLEDGAGPFFLEGVHRSGDADDERVLALVLLRVRLQVRHRRRHHNTILLQLELVLFHLASGDY